MPRIQSSPARRVHQVQSASTDPKNVLTAKQDRMPTPTTQHAIFAVQDCGVQHPKQLLMLCVNHVLAEHTLRRKVFTARMDATNAALVTTELNQLPLLLILDATFVSRVSSSHRLGQLHVITARQDMEMKLQHPLVVSACHRVLS